ncbi:DnaJ family domain-containing protein [Parasphingorhabdus pacifica]
MTERKPPDISFETWVDRQIRTAQQRGEFDDLPGAGRPLPGLDKPHDELWWLKNYLHREELSTEALLPTPVQLRKEIGRLPETTRDLRSEQAVRETVDELNRRIVDWLRTPTGPQVPIGPVDAEDIVEQWRRYRAQSRSTGTPARPAPQPAASPRPRWWRRVTRRRRDR